MEEVISEQQGGRQVKTALCVVVVAVEIYL